LRFKREAISAQSVVTGCRLKEAGGLVWYWLGILLVVCCAIAWALLLIGISVDSEDWTDVILGGVIITVIPLALGVFLIKRRRKVPSHHSDTGNATNYEDPKDERRYR